MSDPWGWERESRQGWILGAGMFADDDDDDDGEEAYIQGWGRGIRAWTRRGKCVIGELTGRELIW